MSLIIPKTEALRRVISYAGLDNVQITNAKRGIYEGNNSFNLKQKKDDVLGLSSLGTPVYTDLVLMGCNYTDNITGQQVTLKNDLYKTGDSRSPVKGSSNELGGSFYMTLS